MLYTITVPKATLTWKKYIFKIGCIKVSHLLQRSSKVYLQVYSFLCLIYRFSYVLGQVQHVLIHSEIHLYQYSSWNVCIQTLPQTYHFFRSSFFERKNRFEILILDISNTRVFFKIFCNSWKGAKFLFLKIIRRIRYI